MTITAAQALAAHASAECLYTPADVDAAFARIARDITARLSGREPLVLCVLTGGIVAAGQLLPRLDFPLQLDYIHATRYRGETSGGELRWIAQPHQPLAGRSVLVVDDILDEGPTLAGILAHCRSAGAREVLAAVLVNKLHDRKAPGARADFIGLDVPDRYVYGYGMDYYSFLRNAPGIFAVQE